MANNLTLSVTLTGDNRQLSGTLKDAQGDVREFSTTTERESKKAETALEAPGRSAITVSDHLRETQREARTFGSETQRSGRQATQALTATSREVQTTTAHFDRMRSVAVGVGAALVGAFGAGSIINRAGLINDADALANSIGIATGELQAWDYAAQRTGLSAGTMGDIFKDVSDKLGDFAATGGGEAADLFENLNLQIGALQRLSPDQQLLKIADAISQIEDPSQRIFYLESLANDATRLLPLLQDNAAGLRELTDEAYAMGAAMDQVDIDNALEADRAMAQLRGTTQGFLNLLAADLGPALADTVGNLTELIQSAGGADQVLQTVTNTVTVVGAAAGAYGTYRGVIAAATVAQWAFNTAVRANPLGIAITLLGAAAGAMFAYREEVTLAGSESFQTSIDVDGLTSSFHLLTEAQQENKRASLTADLIEMRVEAGRLGSELVEVSRKVRNSGQLTPEGGAMPIATPEDIQQGRELRQELGMLLSDIDNGSQLLSEYDQAMAALGETTRDTDTRTRTLAETNAAATKAADELANSTQAQADALEELHNRLRPGRREVVQLADDMRTLTLAIATGTGNVAENIQLMGLLQQQYIEAQNDTDDLAAKTVEAAFTMEGAFDELRLNGLRRLDDGFADLWQSAIDGSQNAGEIMKRALDQTLAELAHMAITRPIVVQMQGMMGMDGGASGQQAGGQQGQLGNADTWLKAGKKGYDWLTGSGMASQGSAAVGYGGSGWASQVGTNTYSGWAGNASGAAANSGSSWMSGAGSSAMTGIYTAGAGIAGGWAGTEAGSALTGKTANSNYGATIGAAVGTYVLPVIGTFIGSAIGGFADSLFGSGRKSYGQIGSDVAPDPIGQGVNRYGDIEGYTGQSAFGTIGISKKQKTDDDALKEMVSAFVEIDNALAGVMSADQFEKTQAALDGWRSSKTKNIGNIVDERLSAVLAATDSIFTDTLEGLDGDALVTGLVSGIQIENIGAQMAAAVAADMNAEFRAALESGTDIEAATQSILTAAQAVEFLGAGADRLALQFDATAAGALEAAGNLAQIAGGIDNLNVINQGYYEAAYSETERLSRSQAELRASLAGITDQVPTTVAELRAMVEAQNLNDAAAGELAVRLMQLAPALKQANDAVRQSIEEQYQDELGRAPEAEGLNYWFNQVASGALTLEGALWNIAHSAEAAAGTVSEAASEMQAGSLFSYSEIVGIDGAIDDYNTSVSIAEDLARQRKQQLQDELRAVDQLGTLINSLMLSNQSILDPAERLREAQRQFAELQIQAESGDTQAAGQLQGASTAYLGAAASYYGQSSSQYAGIFEDVTGSVSDLERQFGMSVDALGSIESIERQLLSEQKRAHDTLARSLDEQIRSNSELGTLGDLIGALPEHLASALEGIFPTQTTANGGSYTPGGLDLGGSPLLSDATGAVADSYREILGRDPEAEGLNYWNDQLANGATIDDVRWHMENADEIYNGSHADGLWNVPFDGYIAQLHKGELVAPADTAERLRELPSRRLAMPNLPPISSGMHTNPAASGPAINLEPLTRELSALRLEVAQLRSERRNDAEKAAGQRSEQVREQRKGTRNNRQRRATV
ncbi:DUF4214 domain-containing protein [Vreelandella maris]|uniref:DUF4214 domain-containing protein n=1 Tax=Vreelandella maris TaxID=2729617 RepID=A0A7Y6RGA4_9GAMM|nr:DUF4214 domain-containing protein [Halomonas maris]